MLISDQERNWLAAIRAPGLSGGKLVNAVEEASGIESLLGSDATQRKLGLTKETRAALQQPDQSLLELDLAWLSMDGHELIGWDDESYPALLRRIPSPPAALFLDGNPAVLWQPQLAVIGSRNPTTGGLEHARAFSSEFHPARDDDHQRVGKRHRLGISPGCH